MLPPTSPYDQVVEAEVRWIVRVQCYAKCYLLRLIIWWVLYDALLRFVFKCVCDSLAAGVDLDHLVARGGLAMRLLCGIVLVVTVAYVTNAWTQDIQYTRDRNGRLNVQVNPGAHAIGPYRNLIPFSTPGLSVQGSVGGSAPKLVQDFGNLPVVVPYARPGWTNAAPQPIPERRIYYTVPPNTSKPYMKICKHTGDTTVCKEFDMGP